jgi:S1-C subfamily serine protease
MTRILTIIALLFATPAWAVNLRIGIDDTYSCPIIGKDLGCIEKISIDGVEVKGFNSILAAIYSASTSSFVTVHWEGKQTARYRRYIEFSDRADAYIASHEDFSTTAGRLKDEITQKQKINEKREKMALEAQILAAKNKEKDEELLAIGSGTAFSIDYLGHLISNHHVVDGCEKMSVAHKGTRVEVSLLASDPKNDLALLKLQERPRVFFYLASNPPEVMQDVFVGGYPFGEIVSSEVKVTKGIVSSLAGFNNDYSRFMLDAALQPGNSGGPIFTADGELFGIAVAKLDLLAFVSAFDVVPEGTNFGIKNSVLREFLTSNRIQIPKLPFFGSSFDLHELVNDGIFHLVCFAKRKNIPQIKEQKVVFKEFSK